MQCLDCPRQTSGHAQRCSACRTARINRMRRDRGSTRQQREDALVRRESVALVDAAIASIWTRMRWYGWRIA